MSHLKSCVETEARRVMCSAASCLYFILRSVADQGAENNRQNPGMQEFKRQKTHIRVCINGAQVEQDNRVVDIKLTRKKQLCS